MAVGASTACEFEVERHIHCNQNGEKVCGQNKTLEIHEKEASISNVTAPKIKIHGEEEDASEGKKGCPESWCCVVGALSLRG